MATVDTLDNCWGVKLVTLLNKPREVKFTKFDYDVRKDVPDYRLYSVVSSGSNANQDACVLASEYDLEGVIVGLGSYIGGNDFSTELSTAQYTLKSDFSLPSMVTEVSVRTVLQTVPLPYWVPTSALSRQEKTQHENNCLRHIHQYLVHHWLKGKPKKVLLLEYILGGNGGELSSRFLDMLARILIEFNVVVVADEVLTGGRVGPKMTMTHSFSSLWRSVVKYITMGKFMNCALILERIPKGRESQVERRGTSTIFDCSEAYAYWIAVRGHIDSGTIEERGRQVKAALKIKDPNEMWGKGLLLFTSKKRGQSLEGLKGRALPRMDRNAKISTVKQTVTKWNRLTMTELLRDTAKQWITEQVRTEQRVTNYVL
jgi:hypothetical protein